MEGHCYTKRERNPFLFPEVLSTTKRPNKKQPPRTSHLGTPMEGGRDLWVQANPWLTGTELLRNETPAPTREMNIETENVVEKSNKRKKDKQDKVGA